jgi:hypothetical protein
MYAMQKDLILKSLSEPIREVETSKLIYVFDITSIAVIHRAEDIVTFIKNVEDWLANNYFGADGSSLSQDHLRIHSLIKRSIWK